MRERNPVPYRQLCAHQWSRLGYLDSCADLTCVGLRPIDRFLDEIERCRNPIFEARVGERFAENRDAVPEAQIVVVEPRA